MDKRNKTLAVVAATVALSSGALLAEQEKDAALAQAAEKNGEGVRTVRLIQDDAQPRMASKLYELKNAKATDVRPFVEAAVKRYSTASRVERVNYPEAGRQLFLVTTPEDFLPYVDDIIAALDEHSVKDSKRSVSTIDGTGITRVTYRPKWRSGEDIATIVGSAVNTGEGATFFNPVNNEVYFKDELATATCISNFLAAVDHPLPQAKLVFELYEVRESDLRDIGVDYLAWKNGPGLDLAAFGYSDGRVHNTDTAFFQALDALGDGVLDAWGHGGYLASAVFNLDLVRLLRQNGTAKLSARTELAVLNTPIYGDAKKDATSARSYTVSLVPGYINFAKDGDDATLGSESGESELKIKVNNPVVCFAVKPEELGKWSAKATDKATIEGHGGGIVFSYEFESSSVVERDNRGNELGAKSVSAGTLTLGTGADKVIAGYTRESDVENSTGVPGLNRIPGLGWLFGTVTSSKEHTYFVISVHGEIVHPEG
ncbi:MAG: hypothetical protein K6G91_05710 [Kiritimatiellae bacterium]|nr:hypothetical protein [Kiritimatiellia bacterium]